MNYASIVASLLSVAGLSLVLAAPAPAVVPEYKAVGDLQHPCLSHVCEAGLVCVEQNVQCFAAPCYPIPECH
ncbi:hypothetical protein GQ54DRAFT_298147 [Martensiomyces pterosporus]|nr:hypothetical protein GQ54DRAFT_298147 [Martensiomyces pterosporus]